MLIKKPVAQAKAGASATRSKDPEPTEPTPQSFGKANSLERGLTPQEMAELLRVSVSWLAKARMRGDGPPYTKFAGHLIRYFPSVVAPWLKLHQRSSTSE